MNNILLNIYVVKWCVCFITQVIKKHFLNCKRFKHGIQRKM